MDERNRVAIKLQVFEDESPELFAVLAALPANRVSRRTALLRMLERGALGSDGNEAAPSLRQLAVNERAAAESKGRVREAGLGGKAPGSAGTPQARNEDIPAEDLAELF